MEKDKKPSNPVLFLAALRQEGKITHQQFYDAYKELEKLQKKIEQEHYRGHRDGVSMSPEEHQELLDSLKSHDSKELGEDDAPKKRLKPKGN